MKIIIPILMLVIVVLALITSLLKYRRYFITISMAGVPILYILIYLMIFLNPSVFGETLGGNILLKILLGVSILVLFLMLCIVIIQIIKHRREEKENSIRKANQAEQKRIEEEEKALLDAKIAEQRKIEEQRQKRLEYEGLLKAMEQQRIAEEQRKIAEEKQKKLDAERAMEAAKQRKIAEEEQRKREEERAIKEAERKKKIEEENAKQSWLAALKNMLIYTEIRVDTIPKKINYSNVSKYLSEVSNQLWLEEAYSIIEDYKQKRLNAAMDKIKKGGIDNIKIAYAHFLHAYNIKQDDELEYLALPLKKAVLMLSSVNMLMELDSYGNINLDFDNKVQLADKNFEAEVERLQDVHQAIKTARDPREQLKLFCNDFVDKLLITMWHYAAESSFNPAQFEKLKEIYNYYTFRMYDNGRNQKDSVVEIGGLEALLAKAYAYSRKGLGVLKQMYGEIEKHLDASIEWKDAQTAQQLAAGLMWIGDYKMELVILEKCFSGGIMLEPTVQDRLQFLESGGVNGPHLYEVSKANIFSFDFAPAGWTVSDFTLFFKNLSFKNMKLSYSLVIDDWKKKLLDKRNIPLRNEEIGEHLIKMIETEYNSEIECKVCKTVALTEDGNDEQESIVLTPKEGHYVPYISIVLNCVKIGQNLNLRVFTMFTPPNNTDSRQDMKLALSLKQGHNPTVTAYVESVRESILRVIESILNTTNSMY